MVFQNENSMYANPLVDYVEQAKKSNDDKKKLK